MGTFLTHLHFSPLFQFPLQSLFPYSPVPPHFSVLFPTILHLFPVLPPTHVLKILRTGWAPSQRSTGVYASLTWAVATATRLRIDRHTTSVLIAVGLVVRKSKTENRRTVSYGICCLARALNRSRTEVAQRSHSSRVAVVTTALL